MKRKLVMIGNGMAGVSFLEQLLKLNPNRYDITVIGAEPSELQSDYAFVSARGRCQHAGYYSK